MSESTISLAEAKAHLSELTERAASGESILITRHGKAVARLSQPSRPKQAIDARTLEAVTDAQHCTADEGFMRRVREDARY